MISKSVNQIINCSVILKSWKYLLFIIVYTTAIMSIHNFVPGYHFDSGQIFIPILGIVIGLLLVFRTNTAYDRYWEGRRLWGNMTQHMRTVMRLIWIGVKEPSCREIIEKKTAINLVLAFAYATKCHLREEYSYDNDEFRDLIKHLPKFSKSPISTPETSETAKPHSIFSIFSETDMKKRKHSSFIQYKANAPIPKTNIPVELSYYICSYIEYLRAKELCDGSLCWTMHIAVVNLMDQFTGLECILRTPIPLSYAVHLQHTIWLYLLALPYQLASNLNWWTIPAVALASFSLLGILEIGWEIENPFGYDDNDLPLDDFCKVLRNEIQIITSDELRNVNSSLWSTEKHPLQAHRALSAEELPDKSSDQIGNFLDGGEYLFIP